MQRTILSLIAACLFACFASAADGDAEKSKTPSDAAPSADSAPPAPAAAMRSGDYETAIEGFRKAAESSAPLDPKPGTGPTPLTPLAGRRGLAEALAATGKYDEALAALRAAPELANDPLLKAFAGTILLRRGKLDEARAELEKAAADEAAKVAPRVESLVRLGQVEASAGRLAEARAAFEKSIDIYKELDSDEVETLPPETFVEWGLALIGLNRYEEANSVMFAQAFEKDAQCPSYLLESARALLAKYNYPDSRKSLKEALKQNPRFADALTLLADNQLTDFGAGPNRFEEVEKNLGKALEVNPRLAEAYFVRGGVWLYDGNYTKAMEDLGRALAEDPALLRARGLLAACRFLRGEQDKFAEEEKAAQAINPRAAEFYHTIATALEHRFRYHDSVAMCDRALALDESYWPAFVTLGINCLRTGENARGRKFLDKSWENDKFNLWVFNTRKLLKHMDEQYQSVQEGDFVFYLPKADAAILSAYLLPLIKDAHSRFEARYRSRLKGPIQVEAFSEHKWFSTRTVGLPDFPAAGACFGKLVTLTTTKALNPQNWGAVAWHEFAHVIALDLSQHRVPRWFTEGLSVYEEGLDHPHWARNFQRDLADAWASRRLLPLAELDFGFSKPKYPQQILNSYFQGCLVVKLIVDEKGGFDKVLEILKGYRENKGTAEIFRGALNTSLQDFDRDFEAYMTKWVDGNGYRPRLSEEMVPILEGKAEESPKDVRVLADLAWAYLCNDNQTDAVLTAQKAIDLTEQLGKADCGDAHAVLGLSNLKDKKTRAATEAMEKAIAAGTKFAALCHFQLGSLLSKKEESRAKAIQHFEEAKRLSPIAVAGHPATGNAYYQLAKLYEEAGDEERAILQMVELAKFAVEDAECRQRIVRYALERKKDSKLALKYLDELLYIDPFEAKFHKLLARAAADSGEHDIAIRENQVLLTLPDSNPRTVRLALAQAYLKKGDKEKAASEARRLLQLDPDHEEAKEILKQAGSGK